MSRDSLRRRTVRLESPRLIHAMCLYQHCSRRSVKAKLHHAILVADRSEAGCRPVADLLARAGSLLVIRQIPARCRSATSLGPVCDQDGVMEFGFKWSSRTVSRWRDRVVVIERLSNVTPEARSSRDTRGGGGCSGCNADT